MSAGVTHRYGQGFAITFNGKESIRQANLPPLLWGDPTAASAAAGGELHVDVEVENIAECLVSSAPFGGFIAVCSNYDDDVEVARRIDVFSSLGGLIKQIQLEHQPVFFCWNTDYDHLLVLFDSCTVRVYNAMGEELYDALKLKGGCEPVAWCSSGNGMVVLTSTQQVWAVQYDATGEESLLDLKPG